MRNRAKRFFTFFIGITLILMIIILDPSFLLYRLVVVLISIATSLEVAFLLQKSLSDSRRITSFLPAVFYGSSLVAFFFFSISLFPILHNWLVFFILLLISTIFITSVFHFDAAHPSSTLTEILKNLFHIVYPGLFMIFLILLSTLPFPRILLITFYLSVYLNDGVAYLAGKHLGKNKKLNLPISPHKTFMGFVGGFLTSWGLITLISFLFPNAFYSSHIRASILGMFIGISSILGDLLESVLKRAAGRDNSGNLIPGRGGMLDSIDSCLLSAPVFYYGYLSLFHIL